MVIDGKGIAENILLDLEKKVITLKAQGITPALAVILVGDDPGSLSYIKQKQKAAEKIGALVIFEHFPDTITPTTLESAIAHYNNDTHVHGLIIQRPVPHFIGEVRDILQSVATVKDVDGFLSNSPFEVPVAKAVLSLLESVHSHLIQQRLVMIGFLPWLEIQHIAIIGRGETAGKPITSLLQKYKCATSIVHSQTPNSPEILKQASVIISCVGKRRILKRHNVTNGVILISVGISRDDDGKLHGDYEEDDIKDVASFYTPTPGGVGPVNVASLMQNVVDSCMINAE